MFKQNKVFLGGTCNSSKWRDMLIPNLTLDYFNPVVSDWNDEAVRLEKIEKNNCNIMLFVITPRITGTYSIHEITYHTLTDPSKQIIVKILCEDEAAKYNDSLPIYFTSGQIKSLKNQMDELISYPNFRCLNTDYGFNCLLWGDNNFKIIANELNGIGK